MNMQAKFAGILLREHGHEDFNARAMRQRAMAARDSHQAFLTVFK